LKIKACLSGAGDTQDSYVGKWISILNESRDEIVGSTSETDRTLQMEYEGVRQSLRNLMSFPFVRERVEAGSLSLLGAYFSIIRGVLMFANDAGEFHEVPSK